MSIATRLTLLSCVVIMLTTQENAASFCKRAKERQRDVRRCDYPACNASAADLNIERLSKCPRCRVGLYCGRDHAVQHLALHRSLCLELYRVCDHPGCERPADIKCELCNVATFCSERHVSKHKRACRELRA